MSQEIQENPGGNTKTPGSEKLKTQLYLWMITIPSTEIESPSQLSQELSVFCKKFTFQEEKGEETGYEHYQIFISLKNKEYFTTVKNLFPSKAHIEGCKNGWSASKYCEKNDTRIAGPWNEKSVFIKTITKLYKWQERVRLECLKEPDDRTIVWVWEKDGNMGKTSFCKYMAVNHKACVLNNGAMKDLAYAIGDNPKIVLFNLTRDLEDRINYSALEAIKDGMVFSSKYESKTKIFNSPHVYVFSNFEPRLESMSRDRWKVINLKKDDNLITLEHFVS